MERPSRSPGAARLSLALVLATLVAAFAPQVGAGTFAAPEITDTADDHLVADNAPGCPTPVPCQFTNADILTAWIGNETATNFTVTIHISGSGAATATNEYTWTLNFNVAGTDYSGSVTRGVGASAPVAGDIQGALTVGGVATQPAAGNSNITFVVEKSAIGNPAAGVAVTGLFATSEGVPLGETVPVVSDRAPDGEAFGTDYVLGSGGNSNVDDTDADGLNDTFETDYFGDLGENSTGDFDGDGLTNAEEQNAGTDPTEADTDGDGVSDGDEVNDGTDPLDADDPGSDDSTTDDTTTDDTTDDETDDTSSDDTTDDVTDDTDDSDSSSKSKGPKTLDEAVEMLKADQGYLVVAGALAAVLIVVCIIALAGRWGL